LTTTSHGRSFGRSEHSYRRTPQTDYRLRSPTLCAVMRRYSTLLCY